jgi:DNA-binding winged helix-turn-helix (wHTH) protein
MHDAFKIGDFLIKPEISTISREGMNSRVEPRVMDLLVYLARCAGELAEKERTLQEVWTGARVTEEVLSNAVWKLRRVFEDDCRRPRFIETIPRKGYRLLQTVHF